VIIDIHDVGHGACAVVTAPNGKRLMIDCGHSNSPAWRPSITYAGYAIETLVVTNYDEDHVSDLANLMLNSKLNYIVRNTSVNAGDLDYLKMEYGMGPGIARLRNWMEAVAQRPATGVGPDFGPMQRRTYSNVYPYDFDDENNLSVVTIIEWAGFKMIFPGDLEEEGWKRLLQRQDFRNDLVGIDAFVAAHHGRWTGCCSEVFEIWEPKIVIMSDRDKVFDTQETTSWYQCRTTGIKDASGATRHVYTTRCDGHMRIQVWQDPAGNGWWRIDPYSRLLKAS
jgi:beta-lactamase superfamily II metal-dependent hydrolase